jgi:hypothetical protein
MYVFDILSALAQEKQQQQTISESPKGSSRTTKEDDRVCQEVIDTEYP